MKKQFLALIISSALTISAFAQELSSPSFQNVVWTGVGTPVQNSKEQDLRWSGIFDLMQARVDVWKITFDGGLLWAIPGTNFSGEPFDDIYFGTSNVTQFKFLGEARGFGSNYVNFIFHPLEGFDLAAGTALNWFVGPSPSTERGPYRPSAHVVQGDLRSQAPSAKGLAGFFTYAYKYADKSLAARYSYKDIFTIGMGIDSHYNSENDDYAKKFDVNLGAKLKPFDWLLLAAGYQNCFLEGGNFYTGATLSFSADFKIDAWFGIDGIGYDDNNVNAFKKGWGTGASVFIKFGDLPLWIRPEVGFSDLTHDDYTSAFYVGGRVNWDLSKQLHLGAWSSAAWGAENKNWKNDSSKKDWDGGFIFDLRPELTFDINKEHSITTTFEWEHVNNPDKSSTDGYIFSLYWVFNHAF